MKLLFVKSDIHSTNESSFYEPIRFNAGTLRDLGHNIQWKSNVTKLQDEADILFLSSHAMAPLWEKIGTRGVLSLIGQFKKYFTKIFWCDLSDSTGTTHFGVLPLVNKYLKMQVLCDKTSYTKKLYTGRIHGDYYKKLYQLQDEPEIVSHLNIIPNVSDLEKIHCSWNYGSRYFGIGSQIVLRTANFLNKTIHIKGSWKRPSALRPRITSCRINTSYRRASVSKSRSRVCHILERYIDNTPISYRKYISEMENSLTVVSPFGFGEVCYRDFELVRAGSVCIKQDMGHLETWPNLWKENHTYIPMKWDFSNLLQLVESISDRASEMCTIAQNAQDLYRDKIEMRSKTNHFLERFLSIINN